MYDILDRPVSINDYVLVGRGGMENLNLGKVIGIKNEKVQVFVGPYNRYRYVDNREFYIVDKTDDSLKNEFKNLEKDYKFQCDALNLCIGKPEKVFRRLGGIYRESVVDGGLTVYLGEYELHIYEKDNIEDDWGEKNCPCHLKESYSGYLYQPIDFSSPHIRDILYNERINIIEDNRYDLLTFEILTHKIAYTYAYLLTSSYCGFFERLFLVKNPYLTFKMCVGRISDELIAQTSDFEDCEGAYKLVFHRINV